MESFDFPGRNPTEQVRMSNSKGDEPILLFVPIPHHHGKYLKPYKLSWRFEK